jgi:hypothetical protein
MSTVITAPAPLPETVEGPQLFLAGGITNVADWQETAVAALTVCPGTLYNPRRVSYDHLNPALSTEQIRWEYEALDRSDAILFWFADGGSPQPITLYELGSWARTTKPLIVGVHPDYVRSIDVHTQLGLLRPGLHISNTLDDLLVRASAYLHEDTRRAV